MDFKNKTIKALSIKQPFASAIIHGRYEIRKWYTDYRGLVLICSCKAGFSDKDIKNELGLRTYNRAFKKLYEEEDLLQGYAIAIGNLADCKVMRRKDNRFWDGYYSELHYSHIFENVKRIKPFKWKGQLGYTNVPDKIKGKIITL